MNHRQFETGQPFPTIDASPGGEPGAELLQSSTRQADYERVLVAAPEPAIGRLEADDMATACN